jgi:histidinol-phosphate aminotransferase
MSDTPDRPAPKAGILDIAAYAPGKSKAEGVAHSVKLSANENALGSSEAARAAFAATFADLHTYPDLKAAPLRDAIAARFGLEPERLVFGAGSDELFYLLSLVFLEPGDNIVQGEYAFATYAIAARAAQAQVKNAPEPGYRLSVDELLKAVDERTKIVYLPNPGNPTGTWLPASEIRRLHAELPKRVLLVLDGAYAEFARDPAFDDGLELARTASNIIVTRTFSKLHGLAALRVGWGYGPAEIVDAMERVRPAYNTNAPAQLAAVAALADDEFQTRSLDYADHWRAYLSQQLGGLGLEIVQPSATNFLLIGFPATPGRTAAEAEAALAKAGLIVRNVAGYGLANHLRITIGLEEHNRAVVEVLGRLFA